MSVDEIFINAVENWRKNKGKGTMLCPMPLNGKIPILLVLQRIYNKNPTCDTVIIVEHFNDREEIINFLTNQEDEENNKCFKKLIDDKRIRLFSNNFVKTAKWNRAATLGILYNISEYSSQDDYFLKNCTFKLCVLSSLIKDSQERINLINTCPTLDDFKQEEIDELRTTRPVEEWLIGVDIDKNSEEHKLLEYYNKEITTTLNIFGSLDNVKCARIGNQEFNQSAIEYCTQIALENGWNEHLDMSIEYNKMIDATYNPKSLRDRAQNCYDFIRQRSNLLSDYKGKLNEIYKICKEHEESKILIINKRGEFANIVTDYLNNMFDDEVCGNYHDKVENITFFDLSGQPIVFKTGVNKGKPKQFGAKAQMSRNQALFNDGTLKILSTSNAPSKDLNITVDIVIITSPMCEDIKSYLYRLHKLNIVNDKILLYTIYCKNSIEYKQVMNKEVSKNHLIVNKTENIDISCNNFNFTLAD